MQDWPAIPELATKHGELPEGRREGSSIKNRKFPRKLCFFFSLSKSLSWEIACREGKRGRGREITIDRFHTDFSVFPSSSTAVFPHERRKEKKSKKNPDIVTRSGRRRRRRRKSGSTNL